ncbi:MAG: host cell attachment-required protein, partial [Gammaproteobacteria bacterium]|nr:host cell attachment-required protein [Gammaproteobacteria bacterium]
MNTFVIVADAGRARIFKTETNLGNLTESEDFIHSESRLTNRELGADVPGRSPNQQGSLEPRTFPKEHEEQTFAKQLGKHLKEIHNKRHFDELILVASPKFLGMLRNELHAPLDKLVTR